MNDFIDKMGVLYSKTVSNVKPSILLAQCILESDWGRSELATNANNFGGIKASPPWNGAVYKKLTKEWDGTRYIAITADFAKFDTVEDYVQYHANFFTRNETAKKVYQKVLQAKTYQEQAKALTGTYATDPSYGKKLIDLIEKYHLYDYDKKGTDTSMELRKPIRKITRVNSFGRGSNKPKYIVIHYVGADGNAASNANYFYNAYRGASAHYFIDRNQTYQVVEEDAGAWHVGDGARTGRGDYNGYIKSGLCTNKNSIGIEMCLKPIPGKPVTDWQIEPVVVEQTRLLTKALQKKYNIPNSNVIRHYDVSTKLCPAPWRVNNWAKWKQFKESLATHVTNTSVDRFVDLPNYQSPVQPFKALSVGDTVTVREGMSAWYNPNDGEGVKPSVELKGKQDKIKKVKNVSVGYSKKAYLLTKYNSWILEQDLVEARSHWKEAPNDLSDEEKQSDRYIIWDGKRYEVK